MRPIRHRFDTRVAAQRQEAPGIAKSVIGSAEPIYRSVHDAEA